MQSTRPRDAPTPSGATIRTRPAHTTRAAAGRSDALGRAHSRGTRGTAAAPVGGITLAARKPVEMACHACRPSDRCICSSHRHVRMHGSHARKEHAVTIAGSSVPAVSDAQDDNTLDPRRSGAAQVARDAPLQPDARVERSERWLLCAANDGIRGAWERCAPTHLRLPQDPWRCSATPSCAGRGYSWRSCVMVGTSRGQRGGWTGAAGVLRRACGACCDNGCCSAPASRQCCQRAP